MKRRGKPTKEKKENGKGSIRKVVMERLQELLVLLENFGGFFMEGVGEGVSGRFEGREGSSLDTKFSSETNGKKRLQVKRK